MEEEERTKRATKQEEPKPLPAAPQVHATAAWAKSGPAKSLAEIQAEELKIKKQETLAQQQREKELASEKKAKVRLLPHY